MFVKVVTTICHLLKQMNKCNNCFTVITVAMLAHNCPVGPRAGSAARMAAASSGAVASGWPPAPLPVFEDIEGTLTALWQNQETLKNISENLLNKTRHVLQTNRKQVEAYAVQESSKVSEARTPCAEVTNIAARPAEAELQRDILENSKEAQELADIEGKLKALWEDNAAKLAQMSMQCGFGHLVFSDRRFTLTLH